MAGILDIDSGLARLVLQTLKSSLPEGTEILLLGSTAALFLGVPSPTRTKDVDIALVLVGRKNRIATQPAVREFANRIHGVVTKDPENGSWLRFSLPVVDGEVTVEVIRGKSRDRPQGKFITRRFLQAVAESALPSNDVLVPSLADLIAMKAWAATDQIRHLKEKPGDEYHLRRRDAYRDDTRRLTEFALDRGALDVERIKNLLSLMRQDRQKEIRTVLVEAGTVESDIFEV